MAGDKGAGWLNSLVALWQGDSLESWIAKLIGVFIVLLLLAAMVASVQARGAKPVKLGPSGVRPRLTRTAPPKNRKKKQDKIVRRYRPRSHDGKKKLIRRGVRLAFDNPKMNSGAKPAGGLSRSHLR
jgi:hypothetical protein